MAYDFVNLGICELSSSSPASAIADLPEVPESDYAGINFIHNPSITHPPGTRLEGSKTLPPGQSFCTKTLPSGQYKESKAPPPGHKVRKFHNVSMNSDTI